LLQSTPPGKKKLALLVGALTLLALVIGLAVVAILYFGSQRPEAKTTTPEVAAQPSAQPAAPVAVAIPSPSISATPSKEELARRALDNATKERPWFNGLGMRFVPVTGTQVLFSVWDTRVQDFEMFVNSTGYDATGGMYSIGKDGWKQQRDATWKEPGF
jgi:hypothetical protein